MEPFEFIPEYKPSKTFGLWVFPVFTLLACFLLFTKDGQNIKIFGSFIFTLLMSNFQFTVYYKGIIISDSIIVKRYFYPDIIINYQDIISIDLFYINCKNAKISVMAMENGDYLIKLLKQAIQENGKSEIKIDDKLIQLEVSYLISLYTGCILAGVFELSARVFSWNLFHISNEVISIAILFLSGTIVGLFQTIKKKIKKNAI